MHPVSPDIISKLAAEIFPKAVAWRQHIHQHPELAFEEVKTAKLITSVLDELDIPYTSNIAKTGVVALIEGKNPNKKCIALRADMDALPIQEKNAVSYASQVDGCMHACGHDFHTASLLGTSHVLQSLKKEFEGTIKLIFQPAEEKIPGGAKILIQEGVLGNPEVDCIIGQHVSPEIPAGQVGFKSGAFMASADEIYITVNGKGGHAAMPHQTIDPIVVAAEIVTSLQTVISRAKNPFSPAVLSFGKISGGSTTNVIPEKVELAGTLRTMDEAFRTKAQQKIQDVAEQIAKGHGATAEVVILKGYPHLENDARITQQCISSANTFLSNENVIDIPPRMSAEDFAYYAQKIPACFYRIGTGNVEKGIVHGVHTPFFDVEEDALKTSVGLMAWLAISLLEN